MGRNAKFLKKVKKTHANQNGGNSNQKPASAPAEQKKKANLKAKAYKRKGDPEGHVLGGADYVELLMGGRRKAREEAAKLPKEADL